MSTSIYQKYRPKDFKEVYGQEHITDVLEKSLLHNNVDHAYLFEGPRGTGKTSVARIFAKKLGCSDNDIIEIDAASHRKVEDARELRESVRSLPFDSEKKVYIIDEVHMLTNEAFNTLLKTLEEPPSHVVFILATTESHKIPDTIRSRCQVFQFKTPKMKVLQRMIEDLSKKEGFHISPGVSELVALLGNGSFRDTQTILQKIFSYLGDKKEIDYEEISKILQTPSQEIMNNMLSAIAEEDIEHILHTLKDAEENDIDPLLFLQFLTMFLRRILQIRFSKKLHPVLREEYGEEQFLKLYTLAGKKNGINSKLLAHLLDAYASLRHSYDQYLAIELAFLKIFANNDNAGFSF